VGEVLAADVVVEAEGAARAVGLTCEVEVKAEGIAEASV